jgi:hypothetical protein
MPDIGVRIRIVTENYVALQMKKNGKYGDIKHNL